MIPHFADARLLPAEGFDPVVLNRAVMAAAALAVAAVYLAFAGRFGRLRALGIALLVGTCPEFVGTFNFVLAEFPSLAFLLLGLTLLRARPPATTRWWPPAVAGALALTAAYYFRSMAMLAWRMLLDQ